MVKSISVKRKQAGRPATGTDPLYGVRIPDDLMAKIQQWAATNHALSRSEAIRCLVELGLAGASTGRLKKSATSPKSSELAAAAIDKLADQTAPAEEQAARKRRLLKGPEEFRDLRAERKKK